MAARLDLTRSFLAMPGLPCTRLTPSCFSGWKLGRQRLQNERFAHASMYSASRDAIEFMNTSKTNREFQEIAHCGGRCTVHIQTDANGVRHFGGGFSSSSPCATSIFGIFAVFPGIPVGTRPFTGQPQESPVSNAIEVFIASDQLGAFGHHCPVCSKYWRSQAAPSFWPLTCPYCRHQSPAFDFLTEAQTQYVYVYLKRFSEIVSSLKEGEEGVFHVDEISEEIAANGGKNPFFHSEETQQNKFTCAVCRGFNDILGRYGFCSCCGTYNGLREFKVECVSIAKKSG
jgi:hypothetical protein